jgi:hypothetical protein
MLGLFVMMFLGLNCDIFCLYFYKSFFLPLFGLVFYPDLTSIFFFRLFLAKSCWSFCAESCLQSVPSAGSVKGLRRRGAHSKPKSWIAQSLLSAMWSYQTSWCLRWIVFMRLSKLTTGDTSTPVPASSSLGWSDTCMPT